MRINNNLMAMNTHRQLGMANNQGAKSMEKLSSGLRINKAGDDAAGLSISEKMRGQIRGLNQASRNAQDSISLIQTAEGALNETHAILQRMRELAVQSSNDTNVSEDRTAIQGEMDELAKEITRIANNTEFNTQKLLDGGATQATSGTGGGGATKTATVTGSEIADVTALDFSTTNLVFNINETQVTLDGDYSAKTMDDLKDDLQAAITAANIEGVTVGLDGNKLTLTSNADIKIEAATTGDIGDIGLTVGTTEAVAGAGSGGAIDVSSFEKATASIKTIDDAIAKVSEQRSKLGAWQNRLEHTIRNLDTSSENLQASESRIRDVDMAKEMMEFTKNNILSQAAQAMLAQANQQPQGVLQLLR